MKKLIRGDFNIIFQCLASCGNGYYENLKNIVLALLPVWLVGLMVIAVWQLGGWFVPHVVAHSIHMIATMLPALPPAQPHPPPPPFRTQIILDLD
uniref:Uncharacterized protein n=1 Tax=Romanomermis culicivorax TaxID=13658 RepID=A0A915IVY3_ROMCU